MSDFSNPATRPKPTAERNQEWVGPCNSRGRASSTPPPHSHLKSSPYFSGASALLRWTTRELTISITNGAIHADVYLFQLGRMLVGLSVPVLGV